MNEEAGSLRAIVEDRHDDIPRLIYADWLDERDDVRGEYLRLQCQLVRTWWYDNPCTELYAREAELRTQIDPDWLALVRRCTTPKPHVDASQVVPELKKRA